MPIKTQLGGRPWPRFLSNHNPLYLLSAWLVLHGLSLAFQGEVGLQRVPLMTQLLCAYTLVLALSGWTVVRVGKLWEDARMILLVLLLMFTALSTSYDDLCLKDPATGAVHLTIGLVFCGAVTELVLYLLGIRLPMRYRVPFYLQLAVLFAFPAWLGRLSVDGHDPAMCLGVLAFPVAAGMALLTLLPAAMGTPESENGTPCPWPFFPWSIFVFVAIADGIRAWMLSLSFSPAKGVEPAFLPYFLCPILLAMLVVALEIGLRQRSRVTQWLSLTAMLGVVGMAFAGESLGSAQRLTLDLLESSLAGPPLLVCGTVAAVAVIAMFRRAAGSELVAVAALSLWTCLGSGTRSLQSLHAPNELMLVLAGWQFGYGLWTRTMPRMAFGGIALLVVAGHSLGSVWLPAAALRWTVLLAMGWCAVLPLYCRDRLAWWLREAGPLLAVIAGPWIACAGADTWTSLPDWVPAGSAGALAAICLAYWASFGNRWYVPAAAWAGGISAMLWLVFGFRLLSDMQLKSGLMWYVAGYMMLAVALVASLWKAGVVRKVWDWVKGMATQASNGEAGHG
jgi:hypothetical protein